MKIGEYNRLTVSRILEFGAFLIDEGQQEVLLPKRYLKGGERAGDEMDVFVYNDSEDRPVATTEQPFAVVGDFVLLKVKSVNAVGAFLDWGLTAKDLLVPFREQRVTMKTGRSYVVRVYLDRSSNRVVASAKLDKFLAKTPARYYHRQKVDLLVVQRTDLGYKVIVDSQHWGLLYESELYREVNVGEHLTGFVKNVRPDGKIDVTLNKIERLRVEDVAKAIVAHMRQHGGVLGLNDHSTPEEILSTLGCSKKDFKKAIGLLYREHRVSLSQDEQIRLA